MRKFNRWWRTLALLAVTLASGVLTSAAESPAEIVTPGEDDKDKKPPLPLPESQPVKTDDAASSGLNVDEPDFKATVVVPKVPRDLELKAADPTTGNGAKWALSTEEENSKTASKPDSQPPAASSIKTEQKEEISPALAKAIAKDRNGRSAREMAGVYQEVLVMEPDNAGAHYRLGLALAKSGEILKGLAEIEKAIVLSPKSPKYQCDYGLALLQAGWVEKSLIATRAATQGAPSNPRYQSAFGDCLLAANRVDMALSAYSKAVQLDPNNAGYIYNLGVAQLHGHAYRQAMDMFNEAIKMSPERSTFYCGRGLAHESAGNIKEAIANYKAAIKLDEHNAYAHYLLAYVYSNPDDLTDTNRFEALDHADKAVKLTHYHNAQYLMGLARALALARQFPEAADTARKAALLEPSEFNKKLQAEYEQKAKTDGF